MRKLGDDFRLVMREVDEVEKTPRGKYLARDKLDSRLAKRAGWAYGRRAMLQNQAAKKVFHWLVVVVLLGNLPTRRCIPRVMPSLRRTTAPNLDLFINVLEERIRRDYVDGSDLTYQDLVHGALEGCLEATPQ